jgi:hypothetical protein
VAGAEGREWLPADRDQLAQRVAEARRETQLELAVRALGQLVHVVEREPVRCSREVDPLEQPAALEPLAVVGRVAKRATIP